MNPTNNQVSVRADNGRVTEYTGYKFYRVEDKKGRLLFGFHVLSEERTDVYFSSANVSFDEKKNHIVVRSEV